MKNIIFSDGSREKFAARVCADSRSAHIITVGTKPDLIKMAPILHELLRRGEKAFLLHTGQHYDENLSQGIEKEFGLKVDVNLGVSGGALYENIAEIIHRAGSVFDGIRRKEDTIHILPYVHGDTTTCFAVTAAAFSLGIPVAHIEAGIRTAMVRKDVLEKFLLRRRAAFSFDEWFSLSSNAENYSCGSHEPFPEQWNTRTTEAGTGLFFAPTLEAAENLAREGFPKSRIFMAGNSVVDAATFAGEIASDIFERFPILKDGFVRVCVHRRENTESYKRFTHIFEMVEIVVKESAIPVLWILLPGTKQAIEKWGFSDRLLQLRENKNIVISDVWPKYSDVIAAMKRCSLCATDSGSMQEEMNLLHIPTATLRFGSDRSETLFAKSNVLCPPVSARYMADICLLALKNSGAFEFPHLYGKEVSKKIVDISVKTMNNEKDLMRLSPV